MLPLVRGIIFIFLLTAAADGWAQSSSMSLPEPAPSATPADSSSSSLPTPIDSLLSSPTETSSLPLPQNVTPKPTPYYVRSSLSTSHAGEANTFRNLRNSGTDDTGNMSENSTLPNLSYFSTNATFDLSPSNQISVGGLQSLDPVDKRTMPTPFGKDMVLPGEVLTTHYQHNFNSLYFVEAREVYVDTYHFSDPFLGIGYKNNPATGWGQRLNLSSSVPTTERSIGEHMITKLYLRGGMSYKTTKWTNSFALGRAQSFYAETPENMVVKNHANQVASENPPPVATQPPNPSPSPTPTPGSPGAPSSPPNPGEKEKNLADAPEVIDFILGDHELSRSSASGGTSYMLGDHWKLGCSAGLSLIETMTHKNVWFSSAQPMSATYSFSHWEIGSAFSMMSNIENYKSPPLPTLWNVSLRLGFKFGDKSAIR